MFTDEEIACYLLMNYSGNDLLIVAKQLEGDKDIENLIKVIKQKLGQ